MCLLLQKIRIYCIALILIYEHYNGYCISWCWFCCPCFQFTYPNIYSTRNYILLQLLLWLHVFIRISESLLPVDRHISIWISASLLLSISSSLRLRENDIRFVKNYESHSPSHGYAAVKEASLFTDNTVQFTKYNMIRLCKKTKLVHRKCNPI